MSARVDVVVVGGGPAGLATAGALAHRGASVVVLERAPWTALRVGETLGAEIRSSLEALGAWSAVAPIFSSELPFRGVRSAWGSDVIVERASIFHPLGDGWHVDRSRLDRGLAAWAESEGAVVHVDVGTCDVARDDDGFRVTAPRAAPVLARRLIDASGRGAPASTALEGRRWLAYDRQVAIACWIDDAVDAGHELLIEATEDGWWYAAPRPRGGVVVVLVTDSDLVPAGGRSALPARHAAALARTKHIRGLIGDRVAGDLKVVRADTGRLIPDRGSNLRAVGDAAMATDPLGGNGIARAFESALALTNELDAVADETQIAKKLDDYLDLRARYCAAERRFADAPFWARRSLIDWRRESIDLAPDMEIAWTADPTPRCEALLPPRAIAEVRAALASPALAHEVIARTRAVTPIGDRRLIVGLQVMLDEGTLTRSQARERAPR